MCGIVGAVWHFPEKRIDQATLKRMTDALHHRGPDEEGYWFPSPVVDAVGKTIGRAFGFRRLSIIDLQTGHQPLSNEDGSIWLVFNGEIYNYRSLRRRLEGNGHRFRTQSDSETIVHLYEDEGVDCFQHLNGMFAIAIWDERSQRLVLARDRFGEKPLVYVHQPGRLVFASELKSLLELPDVPRSLNYQALDEYLTYQYVPYPHTIYRHISKLPPAHYAIYEKDRLSLHAYWRLPEEQGVPPKYHQFQEELRALLEETVALRMQSDVPLGAFLSGGIDSSLVVALMKRVTDDVRTFTIGFPVHDYDERQYAARVAQHVGTEHETFEVTPDAVAILPELVHYYDEPFADSSAIPTWYLSRLTRQRVTVALTGDGGDELFLGYPRYWAMQWSWMLEKVEPLRNILAWRLWQRLPAPIHQKSRIRQWKRFCETLSLPAHERYIEWVSIFAESRRAALYTDELIATLPDEDPRQFLRSYWPKGNVDPVAAAAHIDLQTYLPCDLMHKVDIASMAHSLECRQPFLDHRLVERVVALPRSWKLSWWRGKQLIRRTFGDLLPPVIWRRAKMGFGVPLDHWFRGPLQTLAKEILLGSQSSIGTLFRREAVEQLIDEHVTGRFNHSFRLWALIMFEAWRQKWRPEM